MGVRRPPPIHTQTQCTQVGWASRGSRGVGGGSVRDFLGQRAPIHCRFEIEIEPIFGILALYDVREKKKVRPPFSSSSPSSSSLQRGGLPGGGGPATSCAPRSQRTSTST